MSIPQEDELSLRVARFLGRSSEPSRPTPDRAVLSVARGAAPSQKTGIQKVPSDPEVTKLVTSPSATDAFPEANVAIWTKPPDYDISSSDDDVDCEPDVLEEDHVGENIDEPKIQRRLRKDAPSTSTMPLQQIMPTMPIVDALVAEEDCLRVLALARLPDDHDAPPSPSCLVDVSDVFVTDEQGQQSQSGEDDGDATDQMICGAEVPDDAVVSLMCDAEDEGEEGEDDDEDSKTRPDDDLVTTRKNVTTDSLPPKVPVDVNLDVDLPTLKTSMKDKTKSPILGQQHDHQEDSDECRCSPPRPEGVAPRHVFQKAIQMEENLAFLRGKYERIRSANVLLEDKVETKEECIEATRHRLGSAMESLTEVRANLVEKDKDLKEMRSHYSCLYLLKHPEKIDRIDEIIRLRDDCKFKDANAKRLRKEIRLLRIEAEKKDRVIDSLSSQVECVGKESQERAEKLESESGSLRREICGLQDALRSSKRVGDMKSKAISDLTAELEEKKEVEERCLALQADMESRNVEVGSLITTIRRQEAELRRVGEKQTRALLHRHQRQSHHRKESESESESMMKRQPKVVRLLEEEHKYLKKKLLATGRIVNRQKKTIKNQDLLCRRLRSRLIDVDVALQELDLEEFVRKRWHPREDDDDDDQKKGEEQGEEEVGSSDDPVPPRIYRILRKDVTLMRSKVKNLVMLVAEKDEVIESLERHIVALQRNMASRGLLHKKQVSKLKNSLLDARGMKSRMEKTAKHLSLRLREKRRVAMMMKKKKGRVGRTGRRRTPRRG